MPGRSPPAISGRATADHPPGFYGPPEGLLAVNTLAPDDRLAPLDLAALNARRDVYRVSEPQDLRGPVMLAAMGLLALDALVVFFLAGGIATAVPPPARAGRRRASLLRDRRRGAGAAAAGRRRRTTPPRCARRCRHGSPMSSPATPRSTASAAPACRASRCSSRNAPRSKPATRSGSIPARTSSRSIR